MFTHFLRVYYCSELWVTLIIVLIKKLFTNEDCPHGETLFTGGGGRHNSLVNTVRGGHYSPRGDTSWGDSVHYDNGIMASSLEDAMVEAVVQELRTKELLVNPSGFPVMRVMIG